MTCCMPFIYTPTGAVSFSFSFFFFFLFHFVWPLNVRGGKSVEKGRGESLNRLRLRLFRPFNFTLKALITTHYTHMGGRERQAEKEGKKMRGTWV